MRKRKTFVYLCFAIGFILFSCKKEDVYDVSPENVIDTTYARTDNRYGMTVACEKALWTNSYVDTMPENRAYYEGYLYNMIYLGLKKDAIKDDGSSPSSLTLKRFHYIPSSEEDATDFIYRYKTRFYDDLITAYFSSVTEVELKMVGSYKSYYFHVERQRYVDSAGRLRSTDGSEEVYFFYSNGRIYSAVIDLSAEYSNEKSKKDCEDVLQTIKLE